MENEIQKVKTAILTYDVKNIKEIVKSALESGADPQKILDDGMIFAMDEIGQGFKENRIYMPQMLVAAKAMQAGLEVLKPLLAGDGSSVGAGKAIVGSVAGDVHDIGKNLVAIMLQGAGLEVIDLGTDTLTSKFMDALEQNPDAKFVVASSTMTPTRQALRETVEAVRGSRFKDDVVMVGGATMDQQFSDEVGADIYTADAASAAQRAKQIIAGEDFEKVKVESAAAAKAPKADQAQEDSAAEEEAAAEGVVLRHMMEAPIRTVGYGDRKPLTTIENFEETLKHDKGCPDRYVNQYEFFQVALDPINAENMGSYRMRPGGDYYDGFGVHHFWPEGAGGSHPINGPGETVITDITKWEGQLKKVTPTEYPESEWAKVREARKAAEDAGAIPAIVMAPGVFERVHMLMGMQEAMVAYFEHPEELKELVDRITDWEVASITANMENCPREVLFHHDDWGTALNSFLDTSTHRKFFLEPYKRIYKTFRDMGGKYVVHHSDSYAANLVPTMIDVGIDVWQGAITSNDIPKVIDDYGDRIVVMGGIDDSVIDKEGWKADEVAKYTQDRCDEFGVVSFIPCLTRGMGVSIFPGVYDEVSKAIDEASRRKF